MLIVAYSLLATFRCDSYNTAQTQIVTESEASTDIDGWSVETQRSSQTNSTQQSQLRRTASSFISLNGRVQPIVQQESRPASISGIGGIATHTLTESDMSDSMDIDDDVDDFWGGESLENRTLLARRQVENLVMTYNEDDCEDDCGDDGQDDDDDSLMLDNMDDDDDDDDSHDHDDDDEDDHDEEHICLFGHR